MATATRKPRHEARQARTDVYRQHIFDAAEQVFAERGFEATKVQDISRRVGLSMGTIYAIYPSKEDLYRAILEERGGALLQLAHGVAAQALSPLQTLGALGSAYIDYFLAHPNFLRMHLRAGTSWILSPAHEGEARGRLWHDIHALQTDIFRRGVRAGVFVNEDPAYLAKMYSAIDQAVLADWVSAGMKAKRAQLIGRLQSLVERAFCK